MLSYVVLTSFIRTGIESIDESPDRTEAMIGWIESMDGELREFFVVIGRYNDVLIADVLVNETDARAVFTLDKSGSVTTETPFHPVLEARQYLSMSLEETLQDESAWFAEAGDVPGRFA